MRSNDDENAIVIKDVYIPVSQIVTSITISNPYNTETTKTGLIWHGKITLMSDNGPIKNRTLNTILNRTMEISYEELEAKSQELYTKAYTESTVFESKIIQHKAMTIKLITEIQNSGSGITIIDMEDLVDTIVDALT